LGTSEVLIRVGRIPDPAPLNSPAPSQDSGPDDSNVDSLLNPFLFASAGPSGIVRREPTSAEQFDALCEILNDLAGHATRYGAVLQLIVSGCDVERLQQLTARIQAGPVGLVFDPASCVMSGGSPVSFFRSIWERVGYIRLRDAQKDVDGGAIETAFGDGVVDWQELTAVLAEANQAVWMCLERTGGDQRAADAEDAVRRFRSLLPIA
jgi:sugar phosphate isomerase/epimerase